VNINIKGKYSWQITKKMEFVLNSIFGRTHKNFPEFLYSTILYTNFGPLLYMIENQIIELILKDIFVRLWEGVVYF